MFLIHISLRSLFTCIASNAYGEDQTSIQLILQGRLYPQTIINQMFEFFHFD